MRILFLQQNLQKYRVDFFRRLFDCYGDNLRVFYSKNKLDPETAKIVLPWARKIGDVKFFFNNAFGFQRGTSRIVLNKYDVLVLPGNPRNLSNLVLMIRARSQGVTVVWWGHYWSSTSRRWRQLLRSLPMLFADIILFYTDEEVAMFFSDKYMLGRNKFATALNNGINAVAVQAVREKYVSSGRPNSILFIGRLTKKANVALLIQALARARTKNLTLHVIGDGEEWRSLLELVYRLKVEEKVVWHGAITEEKKIAGIANQCRLFCYGGAVGLSLIHAMAYGVPPIVHNNRRKHMPEISAFKLGEVGVAFEYGDVKSLIAAIDNLIMDNPRLDRMSRACVSVVESGFSTAIMARRFMHLIDNRKTLG